jgi:hypothetical protein
MSERVMRASDQDREEAILSLTDAFTDGRLDHAEFETRMSAAQAATYVHDLDPLFADLPARTRKVEPVAYAAPLERKRRRPPFVPLLMVAALTAVLLTTGHVWVLFPLWFLGFHVARGIAWRRHAMAHAASRGELGLHGPYRRMR